MYTVCTYVLTSAWRGSRGRGNLSALSNRASGGCILLRNAWDHILFVALSWLLSGKLSFNGKYLPMHSSRLFTLFLCFLYFFLFILCGNFSLYRNTFSNLSTYGKISRYGNILLKDTNTLKRTDNYKSNRLD